ncbi:hypothetical protein [Bifidobacterium crudilactis]|uniref:hypothetical protein n=1 Tax=Bifidobacterium crudilactis TaxID=327277 RepID=UPI000553A735|nr:hypothetical protein [Bifidobacterium crudilactis]MCI2148757.1 hypothetical protein [Bifidobacterium crudilactis]MCI2156936.1 hypothetical protein [Bifidobacterium crudilactis]
MQDENEVIVHPRIHDRHNEIEDADVLSAWRSALLSASRADGTGTWITVGVDGRGRLLEMMSVRNNDGQWLIYHAMTPPSRKTMNELNSAGRKS